MAGFGYEYGDLPAVPDDLRAELRDRLAKLPIQRLKGPNDWAALVISERWVGLRAARRRGLGRDQRRVVAGLHSSEVNQRIVSARPDLARRHADVWSPRHPHFLYPLVNWMHNERMWAKAAWYRLRYP